MSAENDGNVSQQLEKKVEKYYDDNTKMFLKLGPSGRERVIHQPLYLDHGDSIEKALNAQHNVLLELLARMDARPLQVLDLGCGIGSSMVYMTQHAGSDVQFTGVTLSGKQYEEGMGLISETGAASTVRLVHASFQQLPPEIGEYDLIYGIESFLHSPDATQFVMQVSRVLKRGGVFVLFDDFIGRLPNTRRDARILLDLRRYYQALSLFRPEVLNALVSAHGLNAFELKDHTEALRGSRTRNSLVRMVSPAARLLARWSSYCTFLVGGDARQRALNAGLLRYCMLQWRKPG